ncbi:MAG: glycosyltransferase, partial [Verrucomicrobiae bacterium]
MDNTGISRRSVRAAAAGAGIFTAAYFLIASGLLRRWLRKSAPPPCDLSGLEPATFFRPIKSGEPGLARNLEAFLEGVEPGDRILFGASGAAERALCAALARKFPNLDIQCPPLGGLACLNPKVGKLVQMEPLATHDRWIVLDSDACADGRFLRAFRLEWQESAAAAFSAPYVFEDGGCLASRLDAAGTELALWPGVAVLRAAGRVDFLAGACMGVKGEALL